MSLRHIASSGYGSPTKRGLNRSTLETRELNTSTLLRRAADDVNLTCDFELPAKSYRSEVRSGADGGASKLTDFCQVDVEKKQKVQLRPEPAKGTHKISDRYEQCQETPTSNRLEEIAEFDERSAERGTGDNSPT